MTETTTLSLAEQARANYEKFVEGVNRHETPDIYDELVNHQRRFEQRLIRLEYVREH